VKNYRLEVRTEGLDAGGATIREKVTPKKLVNTNHYKLAVATITLRDVKQLRVTVKLMPKTGASKCKVMVDTAKLIVFPK
jgi:hypothetical protein